MKYVHYQNIIHRDLKPSNILIDENGTVKICDFGISKIMSGQEQQTMTTSVGTLLYMAPEIMDNNNYDEKVDVYSFGILLYFALNNGDISKIKLSDIFQHKKIHIPENFNDFAKELINSCVSIDSSERPSFEEILKRMEKHDCNLVNLSKSEINEVKKFIKNHKEKIPRY